MTEDHAGNTAHGNGTTQQRTEKNTGLKYTREIPGNGKQEGSTAGNTRQGEENLDALTQDMGPSK